MGVANGRFREGDVFIEFDIEDVLFRYEHGTRRFFCKFYGKAKEVEVPHDDRLLNDGIRFGSEIDEYTYRAGRPEP